MMSKIIFIVALSICFLTSGCKPDRYEMAVNDAVLPPTILKAAVPADTDLYELALCKADAWQADAEFLSLKNTREPDELSLDGKSYFWVFEFVSMAAASRLSVVTTNYDVASIQYKRDADLSDSEHGRLDEIKVASDEAYQAALTAGGERYIKANPHCCVDYALLFEKNRLVWSLTFDEDDITNVRIDAKSGKILKMMSWSGMEPRQENAR